MDITNFNKENIQFYTETLWDKIKSRQGLGNYDGTPVGTVISYMGTSPPEGYLACDGTIYNVVLYPELVNHIRENFGSINFFGGNGTSTFAVPDLRGEFLRGASTASRNMGSGSSVGEHQDPTQHVNVLSGLDETRQAWVGTIVKQGINSKGHVNRVLDYDKKINTPQTGVGTFYVADPIDLVSDQNWLGIDFKNEPVMYTSRPTSTSVLYCIKYQMTFSKKEIKYLINTDTLKLIADESNGMCYVYLYGFKPGAGSFDFPKEVDEKYLPTEDICEVCRAVDGSGRNSFGWINLYVSNEGLNSNGGKRMSTRFFESVGNAVPIVKGSVYGQIYWFYKEIGG